MSNNQQNFAINMSAKLIASLIVSTILCLNGCATTPKTAENEKDPYENFNRSVYKFNDKVDGYVAKPISDGYRYITPQFIQTGVYNFYNNLKNVNVVINDALQAKFSQGAQDTGRLALNTTLGLAGIFDVAKNIGWEQNEEDFDQTLATWGVPSGSYLVIPIFGPTTFRGVPGAAFDTAANPATYVGGAVNVVSLINTRANADGALKFIDEAALDPYIFTRESFLQWRNNLATDGKYQASYGPDLDIETEDNMPKKDTNK